MHGKRVPAEIGTAGGSPVRGACVHHARTPEQFTGHGQCLRGGGSLPRQAHTREDPWVNAGAPPALSATREVGASPTGLDGHPGARCVQAQTARAGRREPCGLRTHTHDEHVFTYTAPRSQHPFLASTIEGGRGTPPGPPADHWLEREGSSPPLLLFEGSWVSHGQMWLGLCLVYPWWWWPRSGEP